MAKKTVEASLEFAFFHFLWLFYQDKRAVVRQHYKDLTKKFLDFNNPDKNPKAFLRQPQFEALEIYIFLKEYLANDHVHEIFKAWFEKHGKFSGRKEGGSGDLFDSIAFGGFTLVAEIARYLCGVKMSVRPRLWLYRKPVGNYYVWPLRRWRLVWLYANQLFCV